eukprot:scaffold57817_cov30-Tisochrysis_lutea.AAC.4
MMSENSARARNAGRCVALMPQTMGSTTGGVMLFTRLAWSFSKSLEPGSSTDEIPVGEGNTV